MHSVSLLYIIIIFTTDNFVKHKCSEDIIGVFWIFYMCKQDTSMVQFEYEMHHCDVTTTQQECHIETKVGCSLDRVGV